MKTSAQVDRQAIEVLLSALEAPQAVLSGAALQSFPAHVCTQLLAAELIKSGGHEATTTSLVDHDDNSTASPSARMGLDNRVVMPTS